MAAGSLAHHYVNATRKLRERFLWVGGFVVGDDARCRVCVEIASANKGRMAVYQARFGAACRVDTGKRFLVCAEHAGQVHHLAQPKHLVGVLSP